MPECFAKNLNSKIKAILRQNPKPMKFAAARFKRHWTNRRGNGGKTSYRLSARTPTCRITIDFWAPCVLREANHGANGAKNIDKTFS